MCCCRVDDILISGRNSNVLLQSRPHRLEKQGYKCKLEKQGYKCKLEKQGYKCKLEKQGYKCKLEKQGYKCKLEKQGYKCKLEKSEFMKDSVVYLGHTVSKDGTSPVKSKAKDMVNMKPPKDVDEQVSFLSGVNYYRRCIPNMSKVIAPLEELRKKGVKWKWGKEEQRAWKNLKELLSSETVLTLYNQNLPLKLDTDGSSTGLGAVLSHITPDGTERPIEYKFPDFDSC